MPIAAAGLLFLAYAITSMAWAPAINWFAAANLAGLVGAFCLGAWLPDPRRPALWFVVGMMVLIPTYLLLPFINHNYAAAAIVMALAVALIYSWYSFIPFAVLGLWLSESRGAILAGGIVLFAAFVRRFPTAAFSALAGAVILAASQHDLFGDGSLWQRLGIWQDSLNHLTLFGSGYGSFVDSYRSWSLHTNMTLALAPHAYNDFLELVFELGIGVISFWIMIALCLEREGPKLPAIAFFALSLTYFPLSIPVVAQVFAFSLGHLTRNQRYGTLAFSCRTLP